VLSINTSATFPCGIVGNFFNIVVSRLNFVGTKSDAFDLALPKIEKKLMNKLKILFLPKF